MNQTMSANRDHAHPMRASFTACARLGRPRGTLCPRAIAIILSLLFLGACGKAGESSSVAHDISTQVDASDAGVDASSDDLATVDSSPDTATVDSEPSFDLGEPITPLVGGNLHKLAVDGYQREFIVYLSQAAKTSGNAPVVFMFHGSSQDGKTFYDDSHWRETSDREGLISVFPTALVYCYFDDVNENGIFGEPGERRVGTKWTDGFLGEPTKMPLCGEAVLATLPGETRTLVDHPLVDDVNFVKAMIAFLKANYAIDQKRIYATGFSNGARFVARLTAEMSQVFAATHSHAGTIAVPGVPLDRPMGRIFSVGQNDDRFTTSFGVTSFTLSEEFLTTYKWIAAREVLPDLTMLRLEQDYVYDEKTLGGKTIIRYSFSKSQTGWSNQYMFLVIGGLFHQYPNGTNHPLIAADYLWEFFKGYSL